MCKKYIPASNKVVEVEGNPDLRGFFSKTVMNGTLRIKKTFKCLTKYKSHICHSFVNVLFKTEAYVISLSYAHYSIEYKILHTHNQIQDLSENGVLHGFLLEQLPMDLRNYILFSFGQYLA